MVYQWLDYRGIKDMMKHRKMVYSTFICPDCGCKQKIPRVVGRSREKGHVKDLWCPMCKDTRKMKEIRDNDFYKTLDGEMIYC
jgi:hypothetical protein